MLRTPYVLALALSVVHIPSILAAPPGCTASGWGWPGFIMGSNPWGAILTPSKSPEDSVVSTSCTTSVISEIAGSSSTSLSIVLGGGPLTSKLSSPAAESSSSLITTTSIESSIPVNFSMTTVRTSTISSATSNPSTSKTSAFSSTPITSSTSVSTSSTSSSTPVPSTSSDTPAPSPLSTSSSDTSSPSPAPSSSSSPAPSPSPPSTNSAATNSGSNGSGASDSDVSTYLSTHNSVRAQHGASGLVWNNTLATAAQKWSDGCVFQHSGGKLGPFGENLAAGTGSSYDITSAVTSWTNEASQYDPNNPEASHFTQVVWKATTQVGCAFTSCSAGSVFAASFGNSNFYVCEYFPQGNVIGQFGTEVQV